MDAGVISATGQLATNRLVVERMTPASFEPFGWLIELPDHAAPTFVGVHSRGWEVPFELDATPQISVLFTDYVENPTFVTLERHLCVSQAFIALSGPASVVAVADLTDSDRPPAADAVRAFRIDPPRGYVLRRGAWHSLDRYPLAPPGATFAMFSERETTAEIGAAQPLVRTQVFDYSTIGVDFAFDLEGLQ